MMRRRLLSIALCLCMALTLLPVSALAADDDRSAGWVVDSASGLPLETTVFTAGDGTMTWSPAVEDGKVVSGTLTLNKVTIQAQKFGIRLPVPITLVLQEENHITVTESGETGIQLIDNGTYPYPEQTLTIQGPGSLTIHSAGGGIDGSAVTIEKEAAVSIQSSSAAINTSNGDISITDSTVTVKGTTKGSGLIYANDVVSDDISGGNVVIANSRVVAVNEYGPAISVSWAANLTDSRVVAIGNTPSDAYAAFNVPTHSDDTRFRISGGSLYVKNNNSSAPDLFYSPTNNLATDSAAIYYGGTSNYQIRQGDNIQYASCTYDEASGAVTVGNAFVFGSVLWNDNMLFAPGKAIDVRSWGSDGKYHPGTLTIPAGTTVTVPAGSTLDNYGEVINHGTLNIEGAFYNNVLDSEYAVDGAYDGTLSGSGTVNGIVIGYTASETTYVTHGSAQLYSDRSVGELTTSGGSIRPFKMQVPEGTELTIPEGKTLTVDLTNGGTVTDFLSNNGTFVNNGTIKVVADAEDIAEQLAALDFTGTGLVIVSNGEGGETRYYTVSFHSQGGSAVASQLVAMNDKATAPTSPTRSGYNFGGWYTDEACTARYDFNSAVADNLTLYAKWTRNSTGNTTTTTTTNPDGSVTTTVTDKTTGTVTETTRYPDGSTTVVKTQKDGAVTTIETRADGVKVESATDADGKTTAAVTVPEGADSVTVTIPTGEAPTAGTVAVIVHPDGTQEIVKTAVPTEEGVKLTLKESAKLELVDNTKTFRDVPALHWAAESVTFVAARELFKGTSEDLFSPDAPMTRAMLWTVLARLDGADTTGGDVWYAEGRSWAMENGVSDGTGPEKSVNREQLATMLWRYAGSPETEGTLDGFQDADQVSGFAADAMRWAAARGILTGMGGGILDPKGPATRAQVAAVLMRYLSVMAD